MKNDLKVIMDDFKKLSDACKELEDKSIYIGIIGGGEAAKIAHIHEYGDGRMPERSFIRASFDADQDKLTEIIEAQVTKVLEGGTSATAAANAVGAQAAQLVQNFIDDNRVTPQSDFSRKTQHTTLYETGTHIRDRISYEVGGS